ncbi:diaminohydroxyphosphoribosylaminopyrimidine deaminase/5-amino-6-(5-phosphoribosylamino)uracil reductase [Leucobacter aridicollis]|uniref:Diaminohydroxyphosphoribosylaminopyrimidine deaminase/5-amino-6-(5-phosphoribosylamino)uracil reductase n=1 Tax=Leucobacter aridicollis TaxID=283878 RepID=A0A852RIA3_9MICO|nr:RibD family protein [Leucobacter aridicollis]MCS3427255.1 diaminohydroxyphosphoribosylaminopyrimidine deaminase/5-amino-6-(5-phosphoribosylamino)uracil reductase [Leucobacter aridicollis]NYD27924.1 diaminohydroxyphosphoribosylaminopyrimidine deaminase/5-amino-6-(5-phosphoribosylamino)uracil reductase [Leucobacter aridicollis]
MTTRPTITVKWAQTIDGRAAAADGTSQWITGPAARADVHARRAAADAILIGTGTLLADDPSLTARTPNGELLVAAADQPLPVVVGTRDIPADAKVLRHPALAATGAQPIRLAGADLAADLASLSERGIRSVFVEGGPHIVSSLLRLGLVDELLVYVAPALLGGPGLAVNDLGIGTMTDIVRLSFTGIEHHGPDLLIVATPEPKETR